MGCGLKARRLVKAARGDAEQLGVVFVPEQTGPTATAETPARLFRRRIPLELVLVISNRDFAARRRRVRGDVSVKPPTLPAVAIDDVAQRTVDAVAHRFAETTTSVGHPSSGRLDHCDLLTSGEATLHN